MEIGRRTLFRTCEITWASRRFAVQGHLDRGGFSHLGIPPAAHFAHKAGPHVLEMLPKLKVEATMISG